MDILCFSSSDWHGKWGSRQQVMMRLAPINGVLYIERQAGLEHFWKYPDLRSRRLRRWREGMREIRENLWIISPPPLLPGRYYSLTINRLNQQILRAWVAPFVQRLGFEHPILWLYKPEQYSLIGKLDERLVVYHCIDEFAAGTQGRKRRIIETQEAELIHRADILFANSRLTYEKKRQLNPNTYRISSGADVQHFMQAADPTTEVHPDVASLPHPVLAFVGTIDERIDLTLLADLAEARPNWSIALIGQAYPQATDLKPLRQCRNVHWLGKRPFEVLPSLLRGVDVCLLLYIEGEATRYRSPLKLYEYLATGKPVVSTDHPEVREFSDLVAIVTTSEQFLSAVEHALDDTRPEDQERRLTVARQHSWDARVAKMSAIMLKHLGRR